MCSFPLQSGIHLYEISGCSVSCASKTTLEQTCSGAVVVHDEYLDVSVSVVSVGPGVPTGSHPGVYLADQTLHTSDVSVCLCFYISVFLFV